MKTILFALFNLIWTSSALKPSSGCDQSSDSPHPGESERFYFTYEDKRLGSVDRDFIIQIPPGYDGNTPLPMLFDVHWYGGSAQSHFEMSPFTQMALEKNFISILPNSMHDTASGSGSWNCSSTMGPLGPICDTNRDEWG